MPIISMAVRNKKMTSPATRIVCGNTDYQIAFAFDSEWNEYDAKTARFWFNGDYIDVVFTGRICDVPKIENADFVEVGVFAGDLHTTTPGRIGCDRSILCRGGSPAAPSPDVYAQIMEAIEGGRLTGPVGPQGPRGDTGPRGETGPAGPQGVPGSDANVTAENIGAALGYTPTKQTDVDRLSNEKVDKTSIVQSTGDSETKVMSQKAVTDALKNAGGGSAADAVLYTEQTLTEEQQAQARENIGAIPAPLYVAVTLTSQSNGTVDKTNDEIEAAYLEGREIYCLIPNAGSKVLCPLSIPMPNYGIWVFNMAGLMPNSKNAIAGYIMVSNGEAQFATVTMANVEDIPTTLPNPYSLTINGTTYDGSETVEVNIPKGDMGETGQRGPGLLAVTTGPASYTTAVGDITPKYRMAISTIKSQAGVTEVLLGDTVRYSYYDYPIAYLDGSYAYFTTRVSIRGATGAAGAAGSDATVTKANIEAALGYTPVSPDDIPEAGDNIPDYVHTEAERVAALVQSRQNENTFTFIAVSDAHFSTASAATVEELTASVTHMGQAIGIIREQVHIDLTVSLGDMVWDALDTPALGMSAMRYVSQCLSGGHTGAVHLRARGNHDSLYSSNKNKGTGLLTDAQIFANIGAWNKGSVFDPENKLGGYCYRDFEDSKLRVIVLNSSETSTGGCLYSTKQTAWLTNALDLSEKGAGWRSIILGHHPLDWSRDGGGNPITAVNGASGLICSFHGHTHNYLSGTVSGTSLPRLAIPNACSRGRENEYSAWGEATSYPKVHGTAEDTAFCVVTIDLSAHKIYADHYGAGYDREIDYVDSGGGSGSSYTNLVPTSQAADSTEPYNSTGYKNGVYLSSSGGDSADTACVATGYIPYTWTTGNVLYVKGADVTTESHVRIYGYATKGAAPNNSAICSGPTMDTYFTLEKLGDKYYKLTHKQAAGLVNYLRLSLIGTGENLNVTLNEPIE